MARMNPPAKKTGTSTGTRPKPPGPKSGPPPVLTPNPPPTTLPNGQGTETATAGDPTAGITPPSTRGTDEAGQSALAYLNDTLAQWGLQSIGAEAWQRYLNGEPITATVQWIRSTQTYKDRFSGMAALNKAGESISEAEYITKEATDRSLLRMYGLPDSMVNDRQFLGSLIGNLVSPQELSTRLDYYSRVVDKGVPAETKAYMAQHFGITDGDLMAFWLNPDEALPDLQRKANAALIGGAVARTGWGDLDTQHALQYANEGLTEGQVGQAYGQAGHLAQLQDQLPGDPNGTTIGAFSVQDALLEHNIGAQNQVEAAQRRRQAQFEGAGGIASGRGGISGLGSAAQ